jgi:AcrR family transcriptional regulator
MPKPTFHQLPAAKREHIVALAIREFAFHPYHQASLSRIVADAGIAKGSVYQYFDNKLDLYRWLLTEEVPRRKMEALAADGVLTKHTDLRATLRALVLSGLRFAVDEPELVSVAVPITQPTSDPALRALYREVRQLGHARFLALLGELRSAGVIRDDVDLDLVARVVGIVLGQGLPELLLGTFGVGLEELMRSPILPSTGDGRLEATVDATVSLLVDGIAPRAPQPARVGRGRAR